MFEKQRRDTRKGLKKLGMRRYVVTGPNGRWIIERDRPWRFLVYPEGRPPAPQVKRGGRKRVRSSDTFFTTPPFRFLADARAYAEERANS